MPNVDGAKRTAASRLSMRDKAYTHIQSQIARRELRAGMAVSELALSKELGISRTPIREAMSQLVAEGLLDQTANRSTIVVQLSRQDVVDLYELREALEVFAIGKAAAHPIRSADLERLRSLSDETLAVRDHVIHSGMPFASSVEMHRFVTSDLGFHTLLMRIAANARILRVVKETRLLIRIFAMRQRGHSVQELEAIHREHNEIIQALAAGDPGRSMIILADHIRASQRETLDELDHWEREAALSADQTALSAFPD